MKPFASIVNLVAVVAFYAAVTVLALALAVADRISGNTTRDE